MALGDTSQDCFPWWHTKFDGVPDSIVSMSGCSVGGDGNVSCDPEAMRADAENQLRAAGYDESLSLEEYSLARYIQSEVSSRSIEEAVAVTEAAVNRAALEGSSVNDVLLYRAGSGYGHYGPIHGIGTGVSTHPYGRWASTSQDPSVKSLLIAKLVMSGDSGNFSNGADDQDGPEAWIIQGQDALNNYVTQLAANGKYWVGPLPGVDHWHTFLQFTPGPLVDGQALLQRGLDALQLPAQRPDWGDLPLCSKPFLPSLFGGSYPLTPVEVVLVGLAAIGGLVGAMYFGRWLFATQPA
jgi:hypothetical protein